MISFNIPLFTIITAGAIAFNLVQDSPFEDRTSSTAQPSESPYLLMADSADTFVKKEKWSDAERIMEKMLRCEPGNSMNTMVITNLAKVKFMLEKFGEAAALADIALAKAENSTMLHNLKAKALIADNRTAEGERELELSLECDSLQKWPNLAVGAIAVSKGDVEKGKGFLKRAYLLNPAEPESALPYAEVCVISGNTDEAIGIFENFKLDELGTEGVSRYIQSLLQRGNHEKVNNVIRDALDIFPTDGNLYVLRAVIYNLNHQKSDVEIALKLAKKYNADPQFIEFYFPKKGK